MAAALLLVTGGCGATTTEPSATTPTTETYTALLQPKGAVSRSIQASKAGTITLQLSSNASTDVALGMGFGSYDASGVCAMTTTYVGVADASTTQISVEVLTGTYCVRVYDPGTMVAASTFIVTFTHP